jgi:hypothetical protein
MSLELLNFGDLNELSRHKPNPKFTKVRIGINAAENYPGIKILEKNKAA